jgi:adenylate kinase
MNAIILLGAPGSGKGTIAEKIRDACGLSHVSTGDMLRLAVKNGSAIGRQAESYMQKGALVPDDIVTKIIEDRFDQGKKDEFFLFDGFPRTIPQAELLEKSLAARKGRVSRVFFLDTPRQVLIDRLCGRRACRKCGQIYHVRNIPPKKAGVCDLCGGELYQRADDCEATIVNRLEVYAAQTSSLISWYEGKGLLVRIDSNRNAGMVATSMAELIQAGKPTASDDHNKERS